MYLQFYYRYWMRVPEYLTVVVFFSETVKFYFHYTLSNRGRKSVTSHFEQLHSATACSLLKNIIGQSTFFFFNFAVFLNGGITLVLSQIIN